MNAGVELVGEIQEGELKYFGTVEAEDDTNTKCLFGIPYHAKNVLKHNPTTNETSHIEFQNSKFGAERSKFRGGVVASDGNIYAPPYNATHILRIDPKNNTAIAVGDNFGDTYGKWSGGVCNEDGTQIFFTPEKSSKILKFDVRTQTTSLVGSDYGDDKWKWDGAGVLLNGNIFFPPHRAKQILQLNIASGETKLVGQEYDGDEKWTGATTTTQNGKHVFFIPSDHPQMMKLDTETMETKLVGPSLGQGGYKFEGAVQLEDQNIYMIPSSAQSIARYDPRNDRIDYMTGNFPGRSKWSFPILASDGSIYATPAFASQFIKVDPTKLVVEEFTHQSVPGGLNDTVKGDLPDRLNYLIYAQALYDVITNIESPNSSVCIGILAQWGLGKSFIWELILKLYLKGYKEAMEGTTDSENEPKWCDPSKVFGDDEDFEDSSMSKQCTFCIYSVIDRIREMAQGMRKSATSFCPCYCNRFTKSTRESFGRLISRCVCKCCNIEAPISPPSAETKKKKATMPIPIYFDAWEYEGSDLLWASLMEKMWLEVEKKFSRAEVGIHRLKCKLSTENDDDDMKTKRMKRNQAYFLFKVKLLFSWAFFLGALTVFVLSLVLNWWRWGTLFVSGITWTIAAVPAVKNLVDLYQVFFQSQGSVILNKVKTFEKHERQDFTAETGFMGIVKTEVGHLFEFLKSEDARLIMCIDDLDRCSNETVMAMLQVAILLLNDGPVTCFLAIDTQKIVTCIEDHFGDKFTSAGLSGYQFLEKIIQLPFCLPNLEKDAVWNLIAKNADAEELNVDRIFERAKYLIEDSRVDFYNRLEVPQWPGQSEKLEFLIKLADEMKIEDRGGFLFDCMISRSSSPGNVINDVEKSQLSPSKQVEEEFLHMLSMGIEKKLAANKAPKVDRGNDESSTPSDDSNAPSNAATPNNSIDGAAETNEPNDKSEIKNGAEDDGLSEYGQLFHPLLDVAEREWFHHYSEYFIGRPRKIKKIMNSYVLARLIVKDMKGALYVDQIFKGKLLKFVLLAEQWPYRMSWLLAIVDKLQKEKKIWEEKERQDSKAPLSHKSGLRVTDVFNIFKWGDWQNVSLLDAYESIVDSLIYAPPDHELHIQRDGNSDAFIQILLDNEGDSKLLLKDIALPDHNDDKITKTLRPFLFNLPRYMLEKTSVNLDNCALTFQKGDLNESQRGFVVQYKQKSLLFDQSSTNMHVTHRAVVEPPLTRRDTTNDNIDGNEEIVSLLSGTRFV